MKYKLILLLLLLSNFYGVTTFPIMLFMLILGLYCKNTILLSNQYTKVILYFVFFVCLSTISAYLIREQPILDSLRASSNYLSILFFYLLVKLKIKKTIAENVIILFGILTAIIYIIQFILLQKGIIFLKVQENAIALSTEARFRITCSASIFLSYFCSLNQFLINRNKKYLFSLIILSVPIILQAFRTQIIAIILFSFIMLVLLWYKGYVKIKRIILIFFIFTYPLYQMPIVQEKITYMVEKQTKSDETFWNKDYIRWKCLDYYSHTYQKSSLEYIIGSGIPYSGEFKKNLDSITSQGLFYQDIGLIGLAFIIGPISIFFLIKLFLKPFFLLSYNSRYIYISIYFIFMLSISFTNAEVFRSGNFLIHSLAFYISYLCYKEKIKSHSYVKQNSLTSF